MNLQLSLKRQWFEMTKAGIKTEDYREINEYWGRRLIDNFEYRWKELTGYYYSDDLDRIFHLELHLKLNEKLKGFKPFTTNTMTLGYPSSKDTDRILIFEHAGIDIRTGNTDWGAEPDKLYFVIKHGRRIK